MPLVLAFKASSPTAVLLDPLVLAFNASSPIATFSSPLLKLGSPSSAAPSVNEYKDKFPAIDVLPAKITPTAAKNSILKLQSMQTRDYSYNCA